MNEDIAALKAEMATLRAEVQIGKSYREICNLQASYGYYVDKGLWDAAADLFAPDGTLEIAGRGVYVGQERVRSYLHALPAYGHGILFNHMQLQPVIHVDPSGETAQARWRTFIHIAFLDKLSRWGEAVYENAYRRIDGQWRIAKLQGFITYYCEYAEGLDKGGVPLLRSIDGLQPDLPPTHDYEAFPETFIPPFHYVHPVTGQQI
ncbi:MAG: nuclear transport factor 2 family protein [Sphingobium sp.]|nr:nuclear transport factor 2 family protein [Sphingobium sp.]